MTSIHRRNPLRTYTFHLKLGGDAIAGVQKASGLTMSVQAHEIWEAGNSMHRYAQPDRATWEPITLEQGLALDDTLERWAQDVIDFLHTGRQPEGGQVKRDVTLEVWDPQAPTAGFVAPGTASGGGEIAGATGAANRDDRYVAPRHLTYHIFNAWVSRYVAVPNLDAMGNEVGLLLVELTHEGWRREPTPTVAPITSTAGAANSPAPSST